MSAPQSLSPPTAAPLQMAPPRMAAPPRPSRFYIPTHDSSSSHATSSTSTSLSRRSSWVPSAPPSAPQSPSFRRSGSHGSRASLSALRTALQEYQVPTPPSLESSSPIVEGPSPLRPGPSSPRTPPSRLPQQLALPPSRDEAMPPGERSLDERDRSMSGLRSAFGDGGLTRAQMDALVEIHRVLYRGKEDLQKQGKTLLWRKQGEEVQRVVERWFEGDFVYDHPLVRLSSRQSFLAHFLFLHLVSTFYMPSLAPGSVINHIRTVARLVRDIIAGNDGNRRAAATAAGEKGEGKGKVEKGKGKAVEKFGAEEEWLGLDPPAVVPTKNEGVKAEEGGGWWRLWDITADCREIGGMECYDGYHLALIDHVITLTLFPAISRPRGEGGGGLLSSSSSSVSTLDITSASPSPSFISKVASSLAEELDGLLHWDLPISTIVQFNEVGRATHVRDLIDIRDLIELVPFARRFGWISRCLGGLITSSLGSLALSILPAAPPKANPAQTPFSSTLEERMAVAVGGPPREEPLLPPPSEAPPTLAPPPPTPASLPGRSQVLQREAGPRSSGEPRHAEPHGFGLGIGLAAAAPIVPRLIRSTTDEQENLLGLEGIRGVDDELRRLAVGMERIG